MPRASGFSTRATRSGTQTALKGLKLARPSRGAEEQEDPRLDDPSTSRVSCGQVGTKKSHLHHLRGPPRRLVRLVRSRRPLDKGNISSFASISRSTTSSIVGHHLERPDRDCQLSSDIETTTQGVNPKVVGLNGSTREVLRS